MNIKKFKKGDAITRVVASISGDNSYIGNKLIYKGVRNGTICFKIPYEESYGTIKGKFKLLYEPIHKLRLSEYPEGWEYYKEDIDN